MPFGIYPAAGGLQWCFACCFGFGHGLRLPLVAPFKVLGGVAGGFCRGNGSFLPGMALSGLCPRSGAWRVRASPSRIYPAGGLERHFTCGLSFGHGL